MPPGLPSVWNGTLAVVATLGLGAGAVFAAPAGPGRGVCATETAWESTRARLGMTEDASCSPRGACDDPAIRDATNRDLITIRLIVHVMADANGTPPNGITFATVDEVVERLRDQYAPHGIGFAHQTRVHADGRFYCIRAYSPFNSGWQQDIIAMKRAYAEDPAHQVNLFVGCQVASTFGSLRGIATFPWDPDALTADGGAWTNAAWFGPSDHTLAHELGHVFGLWHTHHGSAETSGCDDRCAEGVHARDDPAADLVGDLCRDTPATPPTYDCEEPFGLDCDGVEWEAFGPVDVSNFMSYAGDDCSSHFTAGQGARMHCWLRHALGSMVAGTDAVVHVSSVALSVRGLGEGSEARGVVRVVDAAGNPYQSATVSARWKGATAGSQSATTGSDGRAYFVSPRSKANDNCWTLTVTGVWGDRVAYDTSANEEFSDRAGTSCPALKVLSRGGRVSLTNHPNPFNPTTTFRFTLDSFARVRLRVYDVHGALVADVLDDARDEGTYETVWNGRSDGGSRLSSGVYYARLTADAVSVVHRIVLVK